MTLSCLSDYLKSVAGFFDGLTAAISVAVVFSSLPNKCLADPGIGTGMIMYIGENHAVPHSSVLKCNTETYHTIFSYPSDLPD